MIRFLVALLLPFPLLAGSLEPAGRLVWDYDASSFGGFSGIYIRPDGSLLIVSDRGSFYWGGSRREDGELVEVWIDDHAPILDSKGNPLTGRNRDAEGMAVGSEGEIYLSFENNHRIMRHEDVFAAGIFMPEDEDFDSFQDNSGMEALAIDADGRLYVIPERSGLLDRPFPVYRFDGMRWVVIGEVPRSDDFLISGADIGPDGRLYVLERGFSGLRGFHIRVRRYDIGDGISGPETLYESSAGNLENFEGISVWQDKTGQLRLTLITDDNFNPLMRTIIEEYRVVD